jgi:3-methyladenine DNA glycosylase AlkD
LRSAGAAPAALQVLRDEHSSRLSALLSEARAALVAAADPARADAMRAYMKSAMPFHGTPAKEVDRVAKALWATHAPASEQEYARVLLLFWRSATHREERYLALRLTRHRHGGKKWRSMAMLPVYEELIVTGAWWDLVDDLAAHAVGDLAVAHPEEMKAAMRAWSRDADLWKRRTSILHQLRRKATLDTALLAECIEGSIADKDFFARKAIGWALRQHAKTDPTWVARYVEQNAARLSGLSKREALKSIAPGDARER